MARSVGPCCADGQGKLSLGAAEEGVVLSFGLAALPEHPMGGIWTWDLWSSSRLRVPSS